MSEDPVKYEPLGNAEAVERLRIDTLTGRKEAAERSQMLRIEALRAAAAIVQGFDPFSTLPDQPETYSKATIYLAKQFAAYLESGK